MKSNAKAKKVECNSRPFTRANVHNRTPGVRAQAISPEGELVQDFLFIARPNALHVLNAPSPAATAALAIGTEIAAMAEQAAAG